LHRLLPWAVVSATVTLVLNQLERQGIIGQIVATFVGMAWNLVTFLTVPILVIEDLGVGAALRRSKDLFKRTWGENVIGQGGLGLVGVLLMLLAVLPVGPARRWGPWPGRARRDRAAGRSSSRSCSALSGIYRTAPVPVRADRRGTVTSATSTSRPSSARGRGSPRAGSERAPSMEG
jgi:hypothetical protein